VKFKFIDFFAGIGGFRQALQNLDGECVFSCEIDKQCEMTYQENYGETFSHDNISTLHENDVPHADIICAGFPCQPFSIRLLS
jgi:DNA (cytosine-5)-methyltransferase 1